MQQIFKQDLHVPYHGHNDEYMCIVSDGNDFMESKSEYMEIWKRDEMVFSHVQVWCKEGLFMTILRCWKFLKRWNVMSMGKCL